VFVHRFSSVPAKATIGTSVRAKPWLIALALVAASCAGLLGVVGPRLARTARSFYEPVSRMKTEQVDFERWVKERAWKEPATPELSAAKLTAFLLLRKDLLELEARSEGLAKDLPHDRKPSFEEISGMMQGVGGLVTGQLGAHRRHDITPDEYRYLKALVYRKWLPAVTEQGGEPSARLVAMRHVEAAADAEANAAVKQRLRDVASSLRERRPAAPEGIPQPVHELLLDHASEIQALLAPAAEARVGR
jgi:hypothetical protein